MSAVKHAVVALVSVLVSCRPALADAPERVRAAASAETTSFPHAHSVRFYVSAVNCEMNAEDAARVNALARTSGLNVEVVFAGISDDDTSLVRVAREDLGLDVSVRLLRTGELQQYKSIGGARLPMALVVKGRQLKTIVRGEAMPRTLSLVEASMSPM